jgi:hypothetical protein
MVYWCLEGSLLLAVQGMHPSNKGGEKPPSPKSWTRASRNVAGFLNRDMGHQGSSAGSNLLLSWHRLSKLKSKGRALRTKGSHLIYPCRRLTHIWLHAILQATSLQCYVNFFTFRFSLSLCLCYAIPSPHYIIRTWLPASFLVFLPAILQQC